MIVRSPLPEHSYLILRNEVARDRRLSYRARGVLLEILSHRDDWEVRVGDLSRGEHVEGRDAVSSALDELEGAGYLVRRTFKDERGRFRTEQTFYDVARDDESLRISSSGGPGTVDQERPPRNGPPGTVDQEPFPRAPKKDQEEDQGEDQQKDQQKDQDARAAAPPAPSESTASSAEETRESGSRRKWRNFDDLPAPTPWTTPAEHPPVPKAEPPDSDKPVTGQTLAAELIDALRAANPKLVLPKSFPVRYGKAFKALLAQGASVELLRRTIAEMVAAAYSDPSAIDSFTTRIQVKPQATNGRSASGRPAPAVRPLPDYPKVITREHINL